MRRRRGRALAVLAALLGSAAPVASGWAADLLHHLPPAVADLHHALRSRDHVIVYRLAPSPAIERVILPENDRARAGRVDGASASSASEALGDRRTGQPAPGDAVGESEVAASGPALSPTTETAAAVFAAAEIAGAAPEGPMPGPVVQHILDRVEVLAEAMRHAIFGAEHGPRR